MGSAAPQRAAGIWSSCASLRRGGQRMRRRAARRGTGISTGGGKDSSKSAEGLRSASAVGGANRIVTKMEVMSGSEQGIETPQEDRRAGPGGAPVENPARSAAGGECADEE